MKVNKIETLIEVGNFAQSKTMVNLMTQIEDAISEVQNPPNSGSFLLYDQKQSNGVKPIKNDFISKLIEHGWEVEKKIGIIADTKRAGPFDVAYNVNDKLFVVEWETGNISSSHRAVNKMLLGLQKDKLIGGVLILPSREMYYYLTDRVGNFKELEPYFPIWRAAKDSIKEGVLRIIEIEHNGVSKDESVRIPKGTDGRALV